MAIFGQTALAMNWLKISPWRIDHMRNARFNALIEKARSCGWDLLIIKKPVPYGGILIRYVLQDEHGAMYFSRIHGVEGKIRRARRHTERATPRAARFQRHSPDTR